MFLQDAAGDVAGNHHYFGGASGLAADHVALRFDVTHRSIFGQEAKLGSLPDAEKRLAPHAALLLEERLRVQAREQARADAERAAAELEKVRRLAEAR